MAEQAKKIEATVSAKPGYKKTKLGWIPEEWEVSKIGDIALKVGSGSTPRGGESVYQESGIPFIRSQNVNHDKLILDEVPCIDTTIHESMKSTKVLPQDILLNITGASIGRSCIVPESFDEGNVNQHVCIIRLNGKVINKFVQTFLSSHTGQKAIMQSQVGGNREGLNHSNVRSIKLPLPPLPEQRAIAAVLTTWDRAIDGTRRLVETKKARQKGLMQQLLTGKKRLDGFDGEWKEVQFKNLIKEVKRPLNFDDEELYQLISVRRRSGGLFLRSELYGHQIKTKNLRNVKTGDFLISKMQIVHGASGLVTPEFDGMKISGSYIAVVPKDAKMLDIEFFNWLSKLPLFYHLTYVSSYGVHIEKMTFNFKLFLKSKIAIPPSVREQRAIAAVLSKGEAEIKQTEQYLATLQQQKKGLMQKLLTGEVRVKTNK